MSLLFLLDPDKLRDSNTKIDGGQKRSDDGRVFFLNLTELKKEHYVGLLFSYNCDPMCRSNIGENAFSIHASDDRKLKFVM